MEKTFSQFIEAVVSSNNFNWFVTLGYAPERRGQASATPSSTAEECLCQWLNEARRGPGPLGPGIRDYLWVEEYRRDGSVLFHVLVADFQGFEDAWEQRWKEISGGWARTRSLDKPINGLLGYFVMRARCGLQLNCGRRFQGRFFATDFRPWEKKGY
jgi:hypothetical protein